ncbi:hypothetical protein DYU11_11660 [Fibrisoma montanum]|uniref:DEAD/DEAH box helicase n=1 Tax=Fibrisoma montanum TaxID=2305895 RepID=A0A418MB77_9BACT|nr:DEAD/DEAH box helicase family protein [Fibrisoma montanum]RIV23631.1 hypothetical protein DYU11_11660 [Fibrisoma montanum]
MIQLRPYQLSAIEMLRDSFRAGHRRVVLCLPTGAGKTKTFSHMVDEHLGRNLTNRALILTHRIELLTQAGGALSERNLRIERITADNRHINRRARCFVGMIDTYMKRIEKMPDLAAGLTMVIIDECHMGNFKRLFRYWDEQALNPVVIGATATPIAASKKDPLSNYYSDIVCPVQIPELIEMGFLSPAVTFSAKQVDRSKLKVDKKGEYSDQSQMDVFAKREVYAGLLDKYREFCLRDRGDGPRHPLKTIVFNVNVEHSLAVTEEFNRAGIPARHLDGDTDPDERESIIMAFKSGAFPVLCNVGILNAGFDDPAVECVVMNRATTSEAYWLQACGRGSRIAPGKDHFRILDMGGNYRELGLWESPRDWRAKFEGRKGTSQKEGVAPVKDCPSCEAIIRASAPICPQCQYEFPKKESAPSVGIDAEFEVVADFREVLKLDRAANWPELRVEQLEQIRKARDRKKGWMIHIIRQRAQSEAQFRDELRAAADLWGYKKGWENYQPYQLPILQPSHDLEAHPFRQASPAY